MIRRASVLVFALLLCLFLTLPACAKTQSVSIDGDHGKLAAVIQTPDGKEKYPAVVICHGFASEKEFAPLQNLADYLEAEGIASIRFDFNGHGESEGRFQDMTVPNEIEDVKKVYAYVRSLPEVTTISIAGHSQGGAVSSMIAGELGEKIRSVVLMAPAAVLRDDAIRGNLFGVHFDALNPPEYVEVFGNHKVGRNYILAARDLPIFETARKYQGVACMIHGTGDTTAPYTYSIRYNEIWPNSELHLVPDWDHVFTGHEAEVARIAADFFIKVLKDD